MKEKNGGRKCGEGCEGCIHYRKIISAQKTKACHFILDEGTPRGCEPGEGCLHYLRDEKKLKKLLKEERKDEDFA